MAKATVKAPVKAVKKKAAPKAKVSSTDQIVKICEAVHKKLNDLNIEYDLQAEISWCLGSFQNDGNPIGLYQMAERSLPIFKAELAKKTKGVTAKLIGDIEKALQTA